MVLSVMGLNCYFRRKNLRLYNRNAFLNSSSSQLDSNMTRLLYIHSIHLFLHSLASYFQQDVIEVRITLKAQRATEGLSKKKMSGSVS